jgi:L-alanine-DL-glutamate epimerase-like enolase superfamily enzyme
MAAMRIAEVHVYRKVLPVVGGPYTMSLTKVVALDSTIVKLVSDTGIAGWGETCPVGTTYQPQHAQGARAALAEMAPGLIGHDALTPRNLRRAMDGRLNGHNYAKAALDIAVLDLMGKHYGARVCDLLGGAATESVPSYYSVTVGEPDEAARSAAEKAREGYKRLQIKVGGRPVEVDIETLRKVRENVGASVRLAADANRSWTTRDALLFSEACRDIQLVLEQPCNTMEEVAAIRGQVRHPIYLDENTEDPRDVLRAVSLGVCDGFGLKVTRLGGLTSFATVRDICAIRSMPHSCDDAWGGDIIAAACTHVGATVEPRLMEGAWIAAPYITDHYDPRGGIRIEAGSIRLPSGPGLGIEPDEAAFGEPVVSFG